MEKVFDALEVDKSHLNAGVKIEDRKLCVLEAQLRSGLGVPKLLNIAYGHDVDKLIVGMSLEDGEAAQKLKEISELKPKHAVSVGASYIQGGRVRGVVTESAKDLASKVPGVFYLACPDIATGDV